MDNKRTPHDKETAQQQLLYSNRLPEAQRDLVRRIRARQDTVFGTAAYKDSETDQWPVRWAEAKADELGRWTVRVKTAKPPVLNGPARKVLSGDQAGDVVISTRTVLVEACFFDALTYCQQFDDGERYLGNVADPSYSKLKDYKLVADEEGIPFDQAGTPVPTADGEILLDADIPVTEIEKAGRSAGNLAPAFTGQSRALVALQRQEQEIQHQLSDFLGREQHVKALQQIGNQSSRMMGIFERSADVGFNGRDLKRYKAARKSVKFYNSRMAFLTFGVGALPLTAGVAMIGGIGWLLLAPITATVTLVSLFAASDIGMDRPRLRYIKDYHEQVKSLFQNKRQMSQRFGCEIKDLESAIKELPAVELRDELQRFCHEADVVYHAFAARESYQAAEQSPTRAQLKAKNNALQAFSAAAARAEIDQDIVAALLDDIATNGKPRFLTKALFNKLAEKSDQIAQMVNNLEPGNVNEVLSLSGRAAGPALLENRLGL